MLTEQERMNHAFKEMLFREEQMAKKYVLIAGQINDPTIQSMVRGLEQATRNHHGTLSQTMQSHGIM